MSGWMECVVNWEDELHGKSTGCQCRLERGKERRVKLYTCRRSKVIKDVLHLYSTLGTVYRAQTRGKLLGSRGENRGREERKRSTMYPASGKERHGLFCCHEVPLARSTAVSSPAQNSSHGGERLRAVLGSVNNPLWSIAQRESWCNDPLQNPYLSAVLRRGVVKHPLLAPCRTRYLPEVSICPHAHMPTRPQVYMLYAYCT